MFKLLILCLFYLAYCSCSTEIIEGDKCFTDSNCNNGYYCKYVDNPCIIYPNLPIRCGHCIGKGL